MRKQAERIESESDVELLFQAFQLFLKVMRANSLKKLGHVGSAKHQYSFVLNIAGQGNFEWSLVAGDGEHIVIIVKLSLGLGVAFVIEEKGCFFILFPVAVLEEGLIPEKMHVVSNPTKVV